MPIRHSRSRSSGLARAAGVLALAGGAYAQNFEEQCPNPIKIWVDAETGSNTTGTGTAVNPYGTITHALAQAPTNCNKTVIIVNPGIYDALPDFVGDEFETFPLVMKRNVSIQGTNALNTTIQGDRECDNEGTPLILFHATQTGDFASVFLDGLNVSRACVGVRISGTVPSSPTLSNLFVSESTKIGVDIVSDGVVHRPKVIHCTFAANQVALVNRDAEDDIGLANEPVPPLELDPPSAPGLLNVLASHSSSQVDFYGIRHVDMAGEDSNNIPFSEIHSGVAVASAAGLTTAVASGFGFTPGVSSMPLYVEEHIHTVLSAASDLRINPRWFNYPEEDGGNPVDTAFQPESGLITWDNGTTGRYTFASNGNIGDWDCEGYGNPRFEGPPDMGADELGFYVLANFASFTTDWNGNMVEWRGEWAGTPSGSRYMTQMTVPLPSQRYIDSGLTPPGNRPRGTSLPYASTVTNVTGTFYLQNYVAIPFTTSPPQPNSIGTQPAVTQRLLFNLQLGFVPVGSSSGQLLTNLQSVFVNP